MVYTRHDTGGTNRNRIYGTSLEMESIVCILWTAPVHAESDRSMAEMGQTHWMEWYAERSRTTHRVYIGHRHMLCRVIDMRMFITLL